MCEVPDQQSFLNDVDRVLKPGGKVVFMEHIRQPAGSLKGKRKANEIRKPKNCLGV